jgi:hypothetical protein
MEMTLIVLALLAAAGGLVMVAASGLRWAEGHRMDLLAAAHRASDRLRMQWLAGLAARLRPAWLFGVSVALGLAVIAAAAAGAGKLMEDVTAGDGVTLLDRPVASVGRRRDADRAGRHLAGLPRRALDHRRPRRLGVRRLVAGRRGHRLGHRHPSRRQPGIAWGPHMTRRPEGFWALYAFLACRLGRHRRQPPAPPALAAVPCLEVGQP